jgi:hypothetical protein
MAANRPFGAGFFLPGRGAVAHGIVTELNRGNGGFN